MSIALLDFEVPRGLRLSVSSLAAPNFATSYALGTIGVVDGSVSYLYSSLPIAIVPQSGQIDLRRAVGGYRHVQELRRPDEGGLEAERDGQATGRREALLYGRLFLPRSRLEALYLRRMSATNLVSASCVSDSSLANGGAVLAMLQHDVGKYSAECLYSTDSAFFGFRGLYNFGHDPRGPRKTGQQTAGSVEPSHGRFSAGAELYYGALNKSGGMSTGIRFTTLPQHTGFPYTMTLTLNPLMGNLSSTYAVKAGRDLALCSRFNFNFYSYESDLQVGLELWRRRRRHSPETEWAVQKLRRLGGGEGSGEGSDSVSGVLKARVDQNWKVGVVWEGRVKELLFSLGASVEVRRKEQIFRAVGVEVQYSS